MDQTDPIENYNSIRRELSQYNEQLESRPEIVVVTKSELPGASDIAQLLSTEIDREVFLISAVTGEGLPKLMNQISQVLEQHTRCN